MSPASIATAAHKRLVWKAKGLGNEKKKGPVLEVWTNPRKSEWKDPLSGSRGLNFAGVSNHPAFLSEKIRIFFFSCIQLQMLGEKREPMCGFVSRRGERICRPQQGLIAKPYIDTWVTQHSLVWPATVLRSFIRVGGNYFENPWTLKK